MSDEHKTWHKYMNELETNLGMTADHARVVRDTWRQLHDLVPGLPLPIADMDVDNERFVFTWSYCYLYLEIEILSDGRVDWFARERPDGKGMGSDNPVEGMPPELLTCMKKVVDGQQRRNT